MQPINFYIERDTDFSRSLKFYSDCAKTQPINMTGWSFVAEIRATVEGAQVIGEFNIDTTNLATGEIMLSMDAADTLDIAVGVYQWDLRIQDDEGQSLADRPSGTVTIEGTVSRA
jgi:hypothetical protein